MPRHLPTTIFGLRRDVRQYLRTTEHGRVRLVLLEDERAVVEPVGPGAATVDMDRATARLLARRLTELLEESR